MATQKNLHYTYPDEVLWTEEAWKDRVCPLFPLLMRLRDKMLEKDDCNVREHYADRQDEIIDPVQRFYYFQDVVDEWKKKGMHFISSGMMGVTMAPARVVSREKDDPAVLYIPFLMKPGNRHIAMNLLEEHRQTLEKAAQEEVLVQFLACDPGMRGVMMEHGLETQGNFRILQDHVYLDLSLLSRLGTTLPELLGEGLHFWKRPETVAGCLALNITDKWQSRIAHQYWISRDYLKLLPQWDYEHHIRTEAGQRQAAAMRIEHDYSHPHDSALLEKWRQMGLRYEDHFTGNDWWVTMTPECAFDTPDKKIPLMLIFKEPRTSIPFLLQSCFQFYYEHLRLAAQGEYMICFSALEHQDDNDALIPGMVQEILEKYPVDPSRIYLTGQSHNGSYALEFYRRHPDMIAAVATLCDPLALENGARVDFYDRCEDEVVSSFRAHDLPLINIQGSIENYFGKTDRTEEKVRLDAMRLNRRMLAFRCKERAPEEIYQAKNSPDYVIRMTGIPADRTEVEIRMGTECYISDFQNEEGKWHLRCVTIENTPHMIVPQMAELSWEFLRRFARDPATGALIERY